MTATLIFILFTLALSAFFSGMEIAYVSANRIHLEIEKKQGGFVAGILDKITRKPSKFIATMLLGNNVALVVYGLYMGDLLLKLLTPTQPLESGFLNYWLTDGLILTQTLLSTLIILIFGEFFPKVFFQLYSNQLIKFFAVPAYFFYILFSFISSFTLWISNSLLKLFFKIQGDEVQEAFTKAELGNYISEQMETSDNNDDLDSEVLIFKNALQFSDIKAREVMIPRTEIVAVDLDEDIHILRQKFVDTGLSKILVYKESIDDIIGYVHSFELFKNPTTIESVLLPIVYVPETMAAKDVLNALIKKRKSIAVVIDEYGGTSGMATVEDIVEEIFGEIEDEHDTPVLIEEELEKGIFKFSARIEIDYLNKIYKLDLPRSENYETLAGLIMQRTEDIPKKGGIIEIDHYKIKILEVSKTRIELVELDTTENKAN